MEVSNYKIEREREERYLGDLGVREGREEVGAKGSLRRLESLMFEAVVDLGCQCLSHQKKRLRMRLSGHPFFLSFTLNLLAFLALLFPTK